MNKTSKILAGALAVLVMFSLAIAVYFFTAPPPTHKVRIACVGDSLTQSSGYPYELWQMLGKSGPYTMGDYIVTYDGDNETPSNGTGYAVGNFGAGSTTVLLNTETPYMNSTMFPLALNYDPDIVVIMLGTNDAQPNLEIYNASFVGDYVTLIDAFKALPSSPEIWIALPPPIIGNQSGSIDPQYFQQTIIPLIEEVANQTGLPTINVYGAFEGLDCSKYYRDGVHVNNAGAEIITQTIYNAVIPNSS
jgi:lysophospholipase L1-like esterase